MPTYYIAGIALDRTGERLSGVLVDAGGGHTDTTAADGTYTIDTLGAGTYAVTPSKTGYTFLPASRAVTVGPDAAAKDFVGAVLVAPATGPPYAFTWDDGVQSEYSTTIWLPNAVAAPQEKRESLQPTLNLGLVKMTQVQYGVADQRAPRRYDLEWKVLADTARDVHAMIEATWANGRPVGVGFHRGGEQVTLSGVYVTAYDDPEIPDSGGLRGLKITLQEV